MVILEKLELFKQVSGYLGAGVFTLDGKMVSGVTDVSGINFEIAGSLFNDAYLFMNNKSIESGFGSIEMFQLNTEKSIFIGKRIKKKDIPFLIILVLGKNANTAMGRLILDKVADLVIGEL